MLVRTCAAAMIAAATAGPVAAAGLLDPLASCTLTVNVGGALGLAPNGQSLGSQFVNGAATMLLVGVNMQPELIFSAPSLTGPAGWSASPLTEMSINTLSGVSTGYGSAPVRVRPGALVDTLTINARVTNAGGFRNGSYAVNTMVTCQSV